MIFAKYILLLLLLVVKIAQSKPYNPFEDYVPSVASLYESWSYLTEPKQAAEGADKVLVKRQYYYIPGPPPPPPPPVTYYAPSPPSQPAAPAPPPPPPSPRGSGSEENHS